VTRKLQPETVRQSGRRPATWDLEPATVRRVVRRPATRRLETVRRMARQPATRNLEPATTGQTASDAGPGDGHPVTWEQVTNRRTTSANEPGAGNGLADGLVDDQTSGEEEASPPWPPPDQNQKEASLWTSFSWSMSIRILCR